MLFCWEGIKMTLEEKIKDFLQRTLDEINKEINTIEIMYGFGDYAKYNIPKRNQLIKDRDIIIEALSNEVIIPDNYDQDRKKKLNANI
jgi:hypothetical protein